MLSPSLIAAIGIFRMLQIPQRSTARNRGNGHKVVRRRRRTDGPFQRPCIPRIIARLHSFEIRNDQVCYKYKDRNRLNKCTDRDQQIQGVPTTAGLIRIDSSWHPQNARNVHHVERQVESDQEEPEMPFAEAFTQHSAGHFGVPVIESGKQRKQNSPYDYVVKVSDNEVRETKLPIDRRAGLDNTGETSD